MHTNFRLNCSLVFLVLAAVSVRVADAQNISAEKEKELIAVLRSDAPKGDKAIACKKLAVDGSSAAAPELAKLLPDPELSSWARIALEAIPGEAVDEVLRKATESLKDSQLVGTINSIGVRRDAKAVELLTARLQDKDQEVASASAAALGHIGNASATKALRQALAGAPAKVRSAIAEGCVLCAERLLADGKAAEASEVYEEVRKADVPKQRVIEATRGAILARNQDGIPLLLEQFRSKDLAFFHIALSTAREFPGGTVDLALAEEVGRAEPERAALIVTAMADRKDTVVRSAVLKAAEQGPTVVRLAAIAALAKVGNESCLSSLLRIAAETDEDLAKTAKATLADLPGENVNAQIIALLPNAEGKRLPLLIEIVGQRRIEATPVLVKALDNPSKAVRNAALIALGETVDLKGLNMLVTQAVAPKHAEDAEVARQALKAASIRMQDREACATELTAAMDRSSSVATKTTLLETLGAMGGTKALATMAAAAKGTNPELQDVSTKLLGEWMTEDAAPVLLDLTKSAPGEKYQIRALKGYIRIARQFVMPEKQRAEMCQKALDIAAKPAEQKMVLDVLKRYPHMETLKLAIKTMQIPAIKEDATQATLIIAQKLGSKGANVSDLLAKGGIEKVKLEIIKAEYGSGSTQKDVTAVLKKQAGDLPLITLGTATYSGSFGGDPLPGTAKQLKVQYRMNGKTGEASFAEDALIVLPMPK